MVPNSVHYFLFSFAPIVLCCHKKRTRDLKRDQSIAPLLMSNNIVLIPKLSRSHPNFRDGFRRTSNWSIHIHTYLLCSVGMLCLVGSPSYGADGT